MGDQSKDLVVVEVRDGVADVRLNRPEKLNALGPGTMRALVDVGQRLAAAPPEEVGAVVLSGEGRAFSAGLDFAEFEKMSEQDSSDLLAHDGPPVGVAEALGQQAVHVWSLVGAPVIAAVHGVAFGGGLQVALGADLRLAAPDARFSVTEVLWGLVPDMMGTQVLPGLVGRDVALELALTGRTFGAEEADRIGLVTRLADDPREAALALAAEVAGHSRGATRGIKRLVGLASGPLEEGLHAEQDVIGALMGGEEQLAAVARRMESLGRSAR
ncbi:enoyl-CoA hydratase-related protein [Nocardioides campestrisoli]|uniref:enoyl-CoA hydratase-related protein n=1 Tax=Nocardioides campestrisoli TaxID=2736757 RepID=UPI00163DD197|nr:enoyl-CoA hydratase-related protein [Nocardioides campestrisoli]